MRLFISLALLIGGLGLCLLDALAHALANSRMSSYVQTKLKSLPEQQTYTRAELAEAVWQTWTNCLPLAPQETYSAAELKTAIVKPFIGSSQTSCNRLLLEKAIRKTAGFKLPAEEPKVYFSLGCLSILVGVFLFGGIIYPDERNNQAPAIQ